MNIKKEELAPGKVKLTVLVSPDKYAKFLRGAALHLGEHVSIPGFRPGKAPYERIVSKVGEMKVLQEALQDIVHFGYKQALEQERIIPAMQPKVDVTKLAPGNAVEFTAEIVVLPSAKLPDLSKIKVSSQNVDVTDEEVEKSLKELQRMRGKEAAKKGGVLPELDDKFARSVNKNFKSLRELRSKLRDNIEQEKKAKEEQRFEQEMLESVIDKAEFGEIAEDLLEDVKNRMVAEMKYSITQYGGKWEDYLKSINKNGEELRAGFDEGAVKRVKTDSVMATIVNEQKLKAKRADIDKEVGRFLLRFPNIEEAKKQVDIERLRLSVEARLLNREVVEFLKGAIKKSKN